jgi:hypothetical protein
MIWWASWHDTNSSPARAWATTAIIARSTSASRTCARIAEHSP